MSDQPDAEPLRMNAARAIIESTNKPISIPGGSWFEIKLQFKLTESTTVSTVDLIIAIQNALRTENIQFSECSIGNPTYGK